MNNVQRFSMRFYLTTSVLKFPSSFRCCPGKGFYDMSWLIHIFLSRFKGKKQIEAGSKRVVSPDRQQNFVDFSFFFVSESQMDRGRLVFLETDDWFCVMQALLSTAISPTLLKAPTWPLFSGPGPFRQLDIAMLMAGRIVLPGHLTLSAWQQPHHCWIWCLKHFFMTFFYQHICSLSKLSFVVFFFFSSCQKKMSGITIWS